MSPENDKQPIIGSMLPNIVQAFRNKGFTQAQLAEEIGKSEAWVSKLLSGFQKSIDSKTLRKLEIALDLDLFAVSENGNLSPLAKQIAEMVDQDPAVARMASALHDLVVTSRATFTPRYVPSEEMADLGKKILKITTANPDKPGKVAKLILQLLA